VALAMPLAEPTCDASPRALSAALHRGLNFLAHNEDDLSARILLSYLQRRFKLSEAFAFRSLRREALGEHQLWGRFVGLMPEAIQQSLDALKGGVNTDQLVMPALYCDVVALPRDFSRELSRFADRGGYDLTHAYLARRLLGDLNCLDAGDSSFRSIAELERSLLAMLRDSLKRSQFDELDVQFEALALLLDRPGAPRPPEIVLQMVLLEQHDDGGWPAARDAPSSAHPTALVVWALLCLLRPDAPTLSLLQPTLLHLDSLCRR
jgi:hypothetical protein